MHLLRSALIVGLTSALHAGTAPTTPPAPADAPLGTSVELRAASAYVFDADFDEDDQASTDVLESRAGVTFKIPLAGKWRLALGAGYGRFDFSGAEGAIPETMQGLNAEVGIEYVVNGRPAIFVNARPGFYSTESLDSDGFDIPAVAAVGYPLSRDFIFSVGALYSGFRDTPVIPIAGFIWTINDQLTFNAMAPTPELTYRFDNGTELFLIGEFTGTTVSVGDDLPEPYRGDNLDYMDLRAGLGIRFGEAAGWNAEFNAGWSFLRQFEYDDLDEEYELEGAPYVRVRVGYKF